MQLERPVPASRFCRLMQLGRLGSGIARSIDSDLNNVAALFRMFRLLPADLDEAFRTLIDASLGEDESEVERAAMDIGYLAPEDAPAYRRAVVDMVSIAAEPAKLAGPYDFGASDLSERLSQHVMGMRNCNETGPVPRQESGLGEPRATRDRKGRK